MKIKQDIIPIILIFIFLAIGLMFTYGHMYAIYSDIGREFYIPWRMNEGDILYKDILNVYAPLGYQINAVFLKIFGYKFISLFTAGFIFSYISLITIYLITKEYSNKIYALLTATLVIFSCTLYQGNGNWIAPYSYSLLYALTFFLLSFLMFVYHIKNAKIKYFILSCLFIGISVSCKYEYSLFIPILIFFGIKNKLPVKQILLSLAGVILPTFISLSVLMIQGCSFSNFFDAINYMAALSHSESVNYFYKYLGIFPTYNLFLREIFQAFSKDTSTLFSSIGFFVILITLFSVIKKDKMLIILCFSMILAAVKSIFSINLTIYSSFFLPLLLIVITAFVYKYHNKKVINILFCIFMISTILVYSYTDIKEAKKNKTNLIQTSQNEKIYGDNEYFIKRYNELSQYIEKETKDTDRIVVMPEGVILNFLTKRKSHNKYYYLVPPNIDIYTESTIINELKNDRPEYIIIFNNRYYWFNKGSFPQDFGKDITAFVIDNYTLQENASDEFSNLYKRKE